MSQTCKVFHREDGLVHVATVRIPEGFSTDEALEYAYRWTQNIEGSWSMKIGADANDNVDVELPLHERNGKVYGLRSSMLYDVIELDGKDRYTVDFIGFRPAV